MIAFSRRATVRGLGGLALCASGGLLSSCAGRRGEALTAVDTHPSGYPTVEAVRYFGQLLSTRSNGRLSLEHYPGGILGQEKDSLEITIFGGIDFNRVNLAPLNSIVPETIVPSLPFLFRSIGHMRAAMDGPPGQRILDAMEEHGLIGLCFYDSGARSFYTTGKAIREPGDLRGLKIRVQSSDLYVQMVRALGGNPTPMDFGEVYQGLLQGTVDGAENNWPSYQNTRHFEAAPFYSETRHVMAPEVLVMSRRSWGALSSADKELIKECAKGSVPYMRRLWDAKVDAARQDLLDAGVTVTEPEGEAFRQLVQPVWDSFLKTPQLRKLAEDIREMTQ